MNKVVAIFFLLSISNLFSQSKQVSSKQTKGKNIFQIDCSIRALELENDSTCWFAGSKNKFGYTNDYGKTWKENVIKYDTFDLEFRSISVTTSSVFILSIGSPVLLFKIDKKTLNYKLVYKETNEKAFYDSMQFWDDENGIAVGDPTEDCMSVIITRDGGNTWNKISCENLPLAVVGEAAFAASNTNISLVDQIAFIVTGGKEANILVGSDYGNNWKKYTTPIIQGAEMTGIFSIDNLSVETAVIAGGNWSSKQKIENTMAITKDGGNSWQLIENNPGYISCVQFIPKTKSLVASSTTGIYYSEDLAESWVKISDEGYYTFRVSENGKYLYFSRKNKLMNLDIATLLSN